MESIQQTTLKDTKEVENFGKYLANKEVNLWTDITQLQADLIAREKRIVANTQQYEMELKEADGTLRQLSGKLSIGHLINENIDRKIEEAKLRLQAEQLILENMSGRG